MYWALRSALLTLLGIVKPGRDSYTLPLGKLLDDRTPAPRDTVSPPLPYCLAVWCPRCQRAEAPGEGFVAAEQVDEGCVRVKHGAIYGTFFPNVNMENVDDDKSLIAGQNFRMPKKQDPRAEEYGIRLRHVRVALGCGSRPALARWLLGPAEPEDLRRLGDSIRKYEDGDAAVPPNFLIWVGERAEEPAIMDYVYKDVDGRLTEDFRTKLREAIAEQKAKNKQ